LTNFFQKKVQQKTRENEKNPTCVVAGMIALLFRHGSWYDSWYDSYQVAGMIASMIANVLASYAVS